MNYNITMGKVLTARGTGSPDHILIASPRLTTVRSDKDIHFTGSLAKNASEEENLTGLLSNKIKITGITIHSDQELHFQLQFFSRDTFTDSDLDEDTFVGAVDLDVPKYGAIMELI